MGTRPFNPEHLQGMVVDRNSLSPENFLLGEPTLAPEDILLVISQSCDVVHAELEEPYVELHVARRIPTINGLNVNGRNPRKLHFACGCTTSHLYEINAKDRNLVRKSDFQHAQALNHCTIPAPVIQEIAHWTGRRYFRVALPEAFSRRVTQRRKDRIKRLLERQGANVHTIYFLLNPESELPEGEPYDLDILVTVDREVWESESRDNLRGVAEQLGAEFDCEGIRVRNAETLPLYQVDLELVSNALRFDVYDYLTVAEGGDPPER